MMEKTYVILGDLNFNQTFESLIGHRPVDAAELILYKDVQDFLQLTHTKLIYETIIFIDGRWSEKDIQIVKKIGHLHPKVTQILVVHQSKITMKQMNVQVHYSETKNKKIAADMDNIASNYLKHRDAHKVIKTQEVLRPIEFELNDNELEIIHLVKYDLTYPEIAYIRHKSPSAIESIRYKLYKKINITTRAELLSWAKKLKIISSKNK